MQVTQSWKNIKWLEEWSTNLFIFGSFTWHLALCLAHSRCIMCVFPDECTITICITVVPENDISSGYIETDAKHKGNWTSGDFPFCWCVSIPLKAPRAILETFVCANQETEGKKGNLLFICIKFSPRLGAPPLRLWVLQLRDCMLFPLKSNFLGQCLYTLGAL